MANNIYSGFDEEEEEAFDEGSEEASEDQGEDEGEEDSTEPEESDEPEPDEGDGDGPGPGGGGGGGGGSAPAPSTTAPTGPSGGGTSPSTSASNAKRRTAKRPPVKFSLAKTARVVRKAPSAVPSSRIASSKYGVPKFIPRPKPKPKPVPKKRVVRGPFGVHLAVRGEDEVVSSGAGMSSGLKALGVGLVVTGLLAWLNPLKGKL